MIISDIYEDVKSITHYGPETLNLSRISDAVEILANKGDSDLLTGYMQVIPSGDLITLPPDVEVPLKVNIDNNPSFVRDKIYPYVMNGPGGDGELVGWQWIDKGIVPIMTPLDAPSRLIVSGSPADTGKMVHITGRTSTDTVFTFDVTLPSGDLSTYVYKSVEAVVKDITAATVLLTDASGKRLSLYGGTETNPQYRQIQISKPGAVANIIFRRNRFRFISQDDFIPVRSRIAILFMVQAIQAYRDENTTLGAQLEKLSIDKFNESEASHNAHISLAKTNESAPIRNLNYNNIDSIIVSDIYDDTCKIVGPIGTPSVFDKITEAMTILGRKAQWDSLRGYVDINTDQYHYLTLPRYVDSIIAINANSIPLDMKSKWFQFHLNGPGETWFPCDSAQPVGEVVTIRDVKYPIQLKAVPDASSDDGKEIIVYGYMHGKEVFHIDDNGDNVEGWVIKLDSSGTYPLNPVQFFDRITRIVKPETFGFVKLLGSDNLQENEVAIGYYYPDETEPKYQRVYISTACSRVRIEYRLRQRKIVSLTDPIHLNSKTAILCMIQAIELVRAGKISDAQALEDKATMLLKEEYSINNQTEVPSIDFGRNFTVSDQFIRC